MRTYLAARAACIVFLFSGSAAAAVSEEEFAQLRAEMLRLAERVGVLEEENRELRQVAEATVSEVQLARTEAQEAGRTVEEWAPGTTFSGDFRYRYEEIDVESRDIRSRHRLRARFGAVARLSNDVEIGLRLAAGSESPVSGNTTLGSGGTSKDLYLDQAYAKWRPFNGAYVTAGKMKNNFYRPGGAGLAWDSDYTPEGLAFGWSGEQLFINAAAIGLESDSRRDNHTFYYGLQGGARLPVGDTVSITAGAAYFDVPVQGESSFFGDADDFFGNSFNCTDADNCAYLLDYEELELFAELTYSGFAMPLNFYADYIRNLDADTYDTGWLAGARLGKASAAGSWQVGYQYEDVEADSVLALLRDSNVGGGGSDIQGHKLFGSYAVARDWTVGFTVFVDNDAGENRTGSGTDYDRVVFDTIFKY
ncbi:hypothetical protein CWI75_07650 [Kineobactrum sediminis]|uniref:Porin n=1 Tax=Kineobactrum sediminis TaxID=1905677 RepID=A0A2N5Y4H0_9GAMM|nr:putative porin [Kineobactrum sediminis]PLW83272.1 hypothetical protein CWI75_07650 [Kineobactrum sediminis]